MTEPIGPNLEAEKATLGAMLMSSESANTVLELLSAEDFSRSEHREIFSTIESLCGTGAPVEPLLVVDELRRAGKLDIAPLCFVLVESCASSANSKSYAAIVAEDSYARRLAVSAEKFAHLAKRQDLKASQIHAMLEDEIALIAPRTATRYRTVVLADAVREAYEHAMTVQADPDKRAGVSTGLADLDRKLGRMQPEDMIVIAARTSHGKSVAACQIGLHASREPRVGPVLLFSLETSRRNVAQRALSAEGSVNSERMRDGAMSPSDIDNLARAATRLQPGSMMIHDMPAISLRQVRTVCKRIEARRGKLHLIVVDYLQIMNSGGNSSDGEVQRVTAVAEGLKDIARDFGCPMITAVQINREAEKSANGRPALHHLRSSGGIEQAADAAILIYNPVAAARGAAGTPTNSESEFIIAKNRNGSCGVVKVGWQPEYVRFVNLETRNDYAR